MNISAEKLSNRSGRMRYRTDKMALFSRFQKNEKNKLIINPKRINTLKLAKRFVIIIIFNPISLF